MSEQEMTECQRTRNLELKATVLEVDCRPADIVSNELVRHLHTAWRRESAVPTAILHTTTEHQPQIWT